MGNRCTYESQILPLPMFGEAEMDWPNAVRLPLYLMGLGWIFLGIAIISDIFMAGIEKVTSLKKRVIDKTTGRTVTVFVWNATVANLTLMALGSSAPEILLSVIEIMTNKMYLGDLGAGTIVGSAAFNLLVISAVCVSAIPDGEVRYINDLSVYSITASCSILAYMWLMFVLMAPPSPNVCETWEAVLTLLFFPMLVAAAYMADRGYCNKKEVDGAPKEKEMQQVVPENVTKDELVQIEQQIRQQHGANLTSEQVVSIMAATYFTPRSRAYYRQTGLKQALGTGKKEEKVATASKDTDDCGVTQVTPVFGAHDNLKNDLDKVVFGWECARYAFLENCGSARLVLTRSGVTNVKATVKYQTRDGSARSESDYEASQGTIVFDKGETKKSLIIKVHDDNAYEENEEFYVDLSDPSLEPEDGASNRLVAVLSDGRVTVVIIDDDDPGMLRFSKEAVEVEEGSEETVVNIVVERFQGATGTIGCSYNTDDMDAVAGMDYEKAQGQIELGPSVQSATIPITIMPKGRFDKSSCFNVVLKDPKGCIFDKESDGGVGSCICNVTIKASSNADRMGLLKKMESQIMTNQALLGSKHWKEQFYSALFVVGDGDDDEEGEEGDKESPSTPSKFDYFMHFIALPWKLLFACVPPPDYCGGWACFLGALVMIAVVTAIVGDMANLVGCTMNIKPEITAITFVALGTSLPDTFASKASAMMDPHADASIGNITGSNSVNVFLGIGISWAIAAIFWESGEATQEWTDKVFKPGGIYYDVRHDVKNLMKDGKAVFVVPAGSLWFNLMVFSANALFAIQHLVARRKKWGGELGGPKKGFMGQYFSAVFLVGQWMIYILASSIFATVQGGD